MMLVEISQIQTADLPLQALRDQLRLATGFSDDALQNGVLETSLRAAMAAIEARTGKVILSRGYRWTISAWRSPDVQALPVAPVNVLTDLTVTNRAGDQEVIDLKDVWVEPDNQRPLLRSVGQWLPRIPTGGHAELTFSAGFADEWVNVPVDLAQAVMLLASHYYEIRHEQPTNDGNMPFGVSTLIERYRTVRIIGGAVA